MTAAAVPDEQAALEVPRLKLDQIHAHPLNPRRDATADEGMVESIRQQGVLDPVMVAPAADGDWWILIDGHRRFDGAGRAGVSDVPVNPRYDLVTEAQQVEVMVITGLQKELLSPVEEAAAYEQLTLLGFDVDAIAASTGLSKARVKSRMKLNDLSAGVRDSLHDGQLTLSDAEAFLEFADDPAAVAELEAAAGTSNFRQQVYVIRGRLERRTEKAARVSELTAAGARQVVASAGHPGWVWMADDVGGEEHRASGMHSFPHDSDLRDPQTHIAAGCLAFTVPDYDYADVNVVCVQPDTHKTPAGTDAAEGDADRQSEWEKQQADRAAQAIRHKAASRARLEWLIGHFTAMFPTKSHQPLAEASKALLPLLIVDGRDPVDLEFLAFALGVEPSGEQDTYQAHSEATEAYTKTMGSLTSTKALAGLAGWLAASVADQLDFDPAWAEYDEVLQHLVLWDWMTGAGYGLSDVDVEVRARLESRLLEVTSDTEPDEATTDAGEGGGDG